MIDRIRPWRYVAIAAQTEATGFLLSKKDTIYDTSTQKPLVPNNSLITKTAEEGRALAVMLARNSIHAMQGELETLEDWSRSVCP